MNAKVSELRRAANGQFQEKKYSEALSTYSKAINLIRSPPVQQQSWTAWFSSSSSSSTSTSNVSTASDAALTVASQPDVPFDVVDVLAHLYCNRSICNYRLYNLTASLEDAVEAHKLLPEWFKPLYRQAEVHFQKQRYEKALQLFQQSRKSPSIAPTDVALIESRIFRSEIACKDLSRHNLQIIQLKPGFEICRPGSMLIYPISNQIWQFARQMQNFIYLICNTRTKECLVVDACWDIDGILSYVKGLGMRVVGCILTHFHIDHAGGIPPAPFDKFRVRVGGIVSLLGKLGKSVPAYMNHADLPLLLESNPELDASRIIDSPDGFSLSLGTGGDAIKIRFMHTPGHSKGSQCVLVNGNRLLTGDTMFVGSCGRVDFPDSDCDQMIDSLTRRIGQLPEETLV
ncbi:MAG: hypothetical protein SGCHY_005176 [Lobulomycetales sp.]